MFVLSLNPLLDPTMLSRAEQTRPEGTGFRGCNSKWYIKSVDKEKHMGGSGNFFSGM